MAAKQARKNRQIHKEREQKQLVDKYSRILQIVAVVCVFLVYLLMSVYPKTEIPVWVPAGLLGVAIGLNPEQMAKIVSDIVKGIVSKK